MSDRKLYISVIIPVYNETKRLDNLEKIFNYLEKQPYSSEVIAVNDGSTDDTLKALRAWQKKHQFKIITYPQNQGKGYAVKKGMLSAQGEYRLFMDVDLSTPIEEIEKFQPYFKKHDVIIATRKAGGSTLLARQPKFRETLGKGFTFLSRVLLGVNVSDFTCGFKCFSQKSAEEIFSRLTINRWGFDSETLFIAKKLNYKIKEITVVWKNDPQTKVKFPEDIINSLSDLLTIRWNNFREAYSLEKTTLREAPYADPLAIKRSDSQRLAD